METQSDQKVRVVALSNLRAMCERVSGTCHRFEVSKVTRSRVHVEYSNPDEYGNESPMSAVFPCFPGTFHTEENPSVVLDIMRVIGDNWDGEGWQAFQPLLDCPTLWRSVEDDHAWLSHAEIRQSKPYAGEGTERDTCTVCDVPVAYEATCHACGWKELHSVTQFKNAADVVEYHKAYHACEPSEHGIARKPDVIVRAITRSEVQS